jgi:hypothetical protein
MVTVIVRDWIGTRELSRLDTAACCRSDRPRLLNPLKGNPLILKSINVTTASAARYKLLLQWMLKREVKVRNWELHHYVAPWLVVDFVERTGGSHVRTLCLRNLKEETAGILMAVFTALQLHAISKLGLNMVANHCGAMLQHLSLINLQFSGNSELNAVSACCIHLTELVLRGCGGNTAQALVLLVSSLPQLKELVLEYSNVGTDAVLRAIAKHLPELAYLIFTIPRGTRRTERLH